MLRFERLASREYRPSPGERPAVKPCRYPVLAVSLLVATAGCIALPTANAGESGGIKDVRYIAINTCVSTPGEIASALPIAPYLRGESKAEPDVCVDEQGQPLTTVSTESDFGNVAGNGLRVSPGGYDVADLLPGQD
jgi:hypothetical protein